MVDGLRAEAVSFGSLLEAHQTLQVPLYQRPYSWRADNIDELWDDIIETFSHPPTAQALFLGPVVFHEISRPDGSKIRNLVDGQQRIATLSLILAAVRARLKKYDSTDSGALIVQINKILFKTDPRTQTQIDPPSELRLRLGKKDSAVFEKLVREGKPSGYKTRLRLAWKAIDARVESYLREKAGRKDEEEIPEEQAKPILRDLASDLYFSITSSAVFARILVEPPYNPLTVFESLNSKSMPLAQSDLIKNLLVQQTAVVEQQETIVDQWDQIALIVPDEMVNFLRAWFIAEFRHITKSDLFDSVRTEVTGPKAVDERLEQWRLLAPWYAAMVGKNPAPTSNQGHQEAIRTYSLMGFRQGIPILLALVANGRQDLLKDAVKTLGTLYIRVLKTASVRGSVFEKEVSRICAEIRADATKGLATLKRTARDLILRYNEDLDWKDFRPAGRDLQRYILVELAKAQQGPTYRPPPPDELEIEHIMPQTASSDAEDENEGDTLVGHIGNLALILAPDNKRCTNKPFEKKRPIYAEYDGEERTYEEDGQTVRRRKDLRMTAELAKYSSWGEKDVKKRAAEMAIDANGAWPLPDA